MLMVMDLLAERLQTMRGQLRDIRATEYSPDGLITAVVGGRGELLELELDPRILREQNASALAESIMDTVRAAAAAAGRESVRLAESLLT
jgi:DNA-binding protein YbaB